MGSRARFWRRFNNYIILQILTRVKFLLTLVAIWYRIMLYFFAAGQKDVIGLTGTDKLLYERLKDRFDKNFRITRLYAALLERCPELIEPAMVEALTADGAMTQSEAVVALLTEAFGLDIDNPDDRRLLREYLTPSVRILDAKRYTENSYYKNIRITDIKDGEWELRQESYAPYRAVICHDMMLLEDFREVPPLGFFPEEFKFPAVLEGGNEWMTLTPVDLDTSEEAIEAAHGKVITFGLGLGYYAYMCSEREEVSSITVVERSADVIRLFKTHILPQFPHRDKVRIIEADAFEYAAEVMPKEGYDVAFVDTWRDAKDGTPMYRRMKPLETLSPNTRFLYWIENFLISRDRAERYADLCEMIELSHPGAPKSYNELVERLLS